MILRTKTSREGWWNEADGSSTGQNSRFWSTIWHIQVPSKLRMFIWRLARHSMPSGEVLHHRHMAETDTCCLCGARDTWRHTLLSCALSRSVWALAPEELVEQIITHQEEDAKDWLFAIYEMLDTHDFTRVVVTMWAIWAARRKAIHEDIFQSPHAIQSFITRFITDLNVVRAEKPSHQRAANVHAGTITRPRAPSENFAKIHVDAGVRAQRGGSAAAVCRDGHGNFLGSSMLVVYGVCDPATLEAIACREAISLAEDL